MRDCGQSTLTKYRQSDKDGIVKCDTERVGLDKQTTKEDDKTDILISMFNPDFISLLGCQSGSCSLFIIHTMASEGSRM